MNLTRKEQERLLRNPENHVGEHVVLYVEVVSEPANWSFGPPPSFPGRVFLGVNDRDFLDDDAFHAAGIYQTYKQSQVARFEYGGGLQYVRGFSETEIPDVLEVGVTVPDQGTSMPTFTLNYVDRLGSLSDRDEGPAFTRRPVPKADHVNLTRKEQERLLRNPENHVGENVVLYVESVGGWEEYAFEGQVFLGVNDRDSLDKAFHSASIFQTYKQSQVARFEDGGMNPDSEDYYFGYAEGRDVLEVGVTVPDQGTSMPTFTLNYVDWLGSLVDYLEGHPVPPAP